MRWILLGLLLGLGGCTESWIHIVGDSIVSVGGRVVVLSYRDPPLYVSDAELIGQREGEVREVRFRTPKRLGELGEIWRQQLQGAGWREVCYELLDLPFFGGPYLRLRYNKQDRDLSLLARPEGGSIYEGGVTYRVELRRPSPRQGLVMGCPLD